MLNFHEENHEIFDFFIKVEKDDNSYNVKALFPEKLDIPDFIKNIGLFCFPYNQTIIDEEYQFYFGLTDSSKKQTYVYVNRKKTVAFCLVTPFFHPHFFLEISYILSGIYESSISRACAKYLESKIYHDKLDWRASWNLVPKSEFELSNFDQYCNKMSPSCELSSLYQFIFSKLPIQYILFTLVAMTLDCRIIVTSSELSNISIAIFSLLALIYPVKWPGTFIPILPSSILTMLDAPFAYLIGIHSSVADAMLSIDRYFIVNIDFHYCASIGMEDFPPEILKYIDERSDTLKKLINRYSPNFPFVQIQNQIRKFIRGLFGIAYEIEKTDDFQQIVKSFNKWKSVPSEEFKAIFSQTQFINGFINEITFEHNQEIFQAFWPNHVFIHAEPPANDDTKEIPKHCGLKRCRKKSIGKQDLEKLLYSSNQSFFDLAEENSSNDNIIENNNVIEKETEAVDENNMTINNNNSNNKIENEEHENITNEIDTSTDNDQHHNKSKRKKRTKVNSVQLSSLKLNKLDLTSNLDGNENILYEDPNQPNNAGKVKKRRSSKHRSQSVENRLLYKNNSYSIMNNKGAKEAPPSTSIRPVIPQIIDNDFIGASDDQNLTPTPRKVHHNLPIPKKPPSKVPEIPLSNINDNDQNIKQQKDKPFIKPKLPISENDGNQSSRHFIRKFNTFNYENAPNGGILLSSSRTSRNSSESKTHQNGVRRVEISKRSSSTALQSSGREERSNDEPTRRRKKKRRTQSNLTEKEKNLELPKINQEASSNESFEKELKDSNTEESKESKISLNETKINKIPLNHIINNIQTTTTTANNSNEFSTKTENKSKNKQNNSDNENPEIPNNESYTPTKQNTNIDNNNNNNDKDEESDVNIDPSKQPITPVNKPVNKRPLPGSSDARSKITSLQLNKINTIRPFRQLTPRNRPPLRNSQYADIRMSSRNLSPSQKFSTGSLMSRNRPKFNINFSDNSSEYEYNYSDSNNEQATKTTKENDKKVPSLSARTDSSNIQRNNILIHNIQRKRKASFENPKTPSMHLQQARNYGNTSDSNSEHKTIRNSEMMTRPRIAPNIRRNIPSKPFNNQKAVPLIKFSSSSDSYDYN